MGVQTLPKRLTPAGGTIGARMRFQAAKARAERLVNRPVAAIAVPAWVNGTAYVVGQVVKGTKAPASQMYQCYTAGTSAGAGAGPFGTDPFTSETDNTAVWKCLGPINPTASIFDIPTLTDVNGAPGGALTNYYHTSMTSFEQYLQLEGGAYYITDGFENCFAVAVNTGVNKSGNIVAGDATHSGLNSVTPRFTFVTDAPIFQVQFTSTRNARIVVDGIPVWQGMRPCGTGGGAQGVKLDYSTTGARRPRTVTVELGPGDQFRGVYVDTNSTVRKPEATGNVRAVIIGDSFDSGGGGFPLNASQLMFRQAGTLLGWNDVVCSGLGGTGLIADNSGNNVTYAARAAQDVLGQSLLIPASYTQIGTFAPFDLIAIRISVNDIGQSGVPAACNTLIATIRATRPTTPIIVLGCTQNANNGAGTAATLEKSVFDALATGDPYLFPCPVSDTTRIPEAWFSGAGYTGYGAAKSTVTGNNSAYVEGGKVHHIDEGMTEAAHRFAQWFEATVLTALP